MLLSQNDVQITGFPITPNPNPGSLFNFALSIFLAVVAILVVIFALWGGLDWIMSGGDKEKLDRAKKKIINAFVGMFIVLLMMVVWYYLAGSLGFIKQTGGGGFSIPIPGF